MAEKRSYRQNCALAHAMDLVGERWTLLIVRELLVGERRYGELLDNLPGMGTNLLASRLKELLDAGLVSKSGRKYALTESGRQLEPVIGALVRFGLGLNVDYDNEFLTRPEWDTIALRAIFDDDRGKSLAGRYVVELNGEPFAIEKHATGVEIRYGDTDGEKARVSLSKNAARELAEGSIDLGAAIDAGKVAVKGSRREAKRLLAAFSMLPPYAFVDAQKSPR